MNAIIDKARAPASKSRGRPRSETKHQSILEAATRLFTELGYDGTSVDDIAAAAGVSKQTVYSHFGSKENLFGLAVAEKVRDSGVDSEGIDADEPPDVLLPRIARQFVDLVKSPEALRVYAICTNSTESHPRISELFYRHGPLKTVEVLADYLQAQHRAGHLELTDPKAAAWQFFCMLKGEAHMRAQFGLAPLDANEENDYIDRCVRMFLRAYST
ncbi:MAG: TetR/AcrR family transcriptional regulator [Xanthomonadales bacterium]|jgi:AcrR family transcriptional regulator|nr:TetR/AcrR family transcriptional regulator [Xanthomonadales bacterium]